MNIKKSFFASQATRPVWFGMFVFVATLIIIVLSSRILYNQTVDLLTENLRQRLLTISITAASSISASDLDQLRVEGDWRNPAWARVVNTLNRAKYDNDDVVFMYIFRKTENDATQMEFVADADSINPYANSGEEGTWLVDVNRDGIIEPEGPDKLQWPGQPYPEAVDIPEAFNAYFGPLTSVELYTDEYGTVLTGYAPIYDDERNVVAILATDIKADDFFTITTQTLRPFIVFILFLVAVIALLTFAIAYTSRTYSKSIEESAEKLEKANLRLQALDKQKSEFVSIASHQLRSPLTAIRGYASLMLEGSYGKISAKARQPIERIEESSKLMAIAIEDYLNVSRIESGNMKYNLTDFNLADKTEDVCDDLRSDAVKNGLALIFRTELNSRGVVNADLGKTIQIIQNLINNSIKYTEKGTIKVLVRDDIKRKRIYVDIIDTGIGISKTDQATIFQKFERAENANSVNVNGTGLGLYVALKMAEAMGGKITASSEGKNKGSVFTLELPLAL
ncbi:MAG: HAMP domain-containing histidine kinase [Candidatus Nomurabacteria bacterium]|nr:MAG: HAMP domain-containing histidine kinase [Candidatus Nomurabacteria bacterium]